MNEATESRATSRRPCGGLAGPLALALALVVGCGDDGHSGADSAAAADGAADSGVPPESVPSGPEGTRIDRGWPQLAQPFGIATGIAGELWVTDTGNRLVRRISSLGHTTLAIAHGESSFELPMAVALDADTDRVWVADPAGGTVRSFSASDATPLVTIDGGAAVLARPFALCIDDDGNVIVGDLAQGGRLRRFAGDDGHELSPIVAADPTAFTAPTGVAIGSTGNTWVLDVVQHRAVELATMGEVVRTIDGTTAGATAFAAPTSIALDRDGGVWIADAGAGVQRFDATGAFSRRIVDDALRVPTSIALDAMGILSVADVVAGLVHRYDSTGARLDPVSGGPASFHTPRGLALDDRGNVWATDTDHGIVEGLDPGGAIDSTLDGSRSGVPLASPLGVALGADRSRWVVEMGANRVRRFDAAGDEMIRIDGTQAGGRPFSRPTGIAIDREGDVWVADRGNHVARELAADGAPKSTIDGSGAGARPLSAPHAVTIDRANGNVWVADGGTVQSFDATGRWLATIDGSTPGATPFSNVMGVAVYGSGRVWVADERTDSVQAFAPDGTWVTTLRGPFESPESVVVDAAGNVWVADTGHSAIRMFTAEQASSAAGESTGGRSQSLDPPLPDGYRFELTGSLTFSSKRYDPDRPAGTTFTQRGSARWAITFVYDPTILQFVADPAQSFIEGERTDGGPTGFHDCSGEGRVDLAASIQTGRYTFVTPYDEGDGRARLQLPVPPVLALGQVCSSAPSGDVTVIPGRPEDHGTLIGPIEPEPPSHCPIRESTPGQAWSSKTTLPFGLFEIDFDPTLIFQGGSPVLWEQSSAGTVPFDEELAPNPGSTEGDCYESDWTMRAMFRGVAPGLNVALGDSFSAGTGALPMMPRPPLDRCLRSPYAWGRIYDERSPTNTVFAACTAATTASILDTPVNEPRPQIEEVPRSAATVVLTIGGNDAQLFGNLIGCAYGSFLPPPADFVWCDLVRIGALKNTDVVRASVEAVLTQLRSQAPDARIAILEYPDPMPRTTSCPELWAPVGVGALGVTERMLSVAHELVVTVNSRVYDAAMAVDGVDFVRTQDRFDADGGHDVCSAQPWFHPATPVGDGTFHPNIDGNRAMAAALTALIGPPR